MEEKTGEITNLVSILEVGTDANAYSAADKLAAIGGAEVVHKMITLLSSPNQDTVYLAARALSKCKDNGIATDAIFELVKNAKEPFLKGVLAEALSGFDCSEYFVEVLKLYLFGSFKVSGLAKEILDDQKFAITPRVIRKAEKHWKHYAHNVKQDDVFAVKKAEVEGMFEIMKGLFEGEELEEGE